MPREKEKDGKLDTAAAVLSVLLFMAMLALSAWTA